MTVDRATHRALVTGATGYIGSNLIRRLVTDGWRVGIIVRPGSDLQTIETVRRDVDVHVHDGTTEGMIDLVAKAHPNVVFHLASLFLAQHRPGDLEELIKSNVLFSTQLAEAMALNEIKYLVNTGTSWQHYEDAPYNPVGLYAATKQAYEDVLSYYMEAYGMKATTLALFDTYGPRDPRPKLLALLRRTSQSQEPLAMSPGEQQIDLVYIDDVIDAFIRAAELLPIQKVPHARYGISSGAPLQLRDLVAVYEKVLGVAVKVEWGARPYRQREVMRPWSNYQSLPGWRPRVTIEEGIRRVSTSVV